MERKCTYNSSSKINVGEFDNKKWRVLNKKKQKLEELPIVGDDYRGKKKIENQIPVSKRLHYDVKSLYLIFKWNKDPE